MMTMTMMVMVVIVIWMVYLCHTYHKHYWLDLPYKMYKLHKPSCCALLGYQMKWISNSKSSKKKKKKKKKKLNEDGFCYGSKSWLNAVVAFSTLHYRYYYCGFHCRCCSYELLIWREQPSPSPLSQCHSTCQRWKIAYSLLSVWSKCCIIMGLEHRLTSFTRSSSSSSSSLTWRVQ